MISVCMIVKDEIEVIQRCINSIYEKMPNLVNEIVVVDTGSTDGTRQLVEKLNCKVYDFKWCNDFSKARNYCIKKAKNDWVFTIDADEFIIGEVEEEKIKRALRESIQTTKFAVNIQSVDDTGEVADSDILVRIFNNKKHKYKNAVHEQLYSIKDKKTIIINTGIVLMHTGYSQKVLKEKNKIEKYIKLMIEHLEENPDDMYMIGLLGKTYLMEEDYEKAIKYLEKVVFNEEVKENMYYGSVVNAYLSCLIKLKDYTSASMLENLWKYCKHEDSYIFNMADVFLETKQYKKAIETYLSIVQKTQDVPYYKNYSYYALGNIFEQFGELEQALICFENCGDFGEALQKIKILKEKIKNNSFES